LSFWFGGTIGSVFHFVVVVIFIRFDFCYLLISLSY